MSDNFEAVRIGIENSFNMAGHIVMEQAGAVGYEMCRPSTLFRPRVFIDGDMWCALYGDNLQDGVGGFGKSVAEAMADFDKNWHLPLKVKP